MEIELAIFFPTVFLSDSDNIINSETQSGITEKSTIWFD